MEWHLGMGFLPDKESDETETARSKAGLTFWVPSGLVSVRTWLYVAVYGFVMFHEALRDGPLVVLISHSWIFMTLHLSYIESSVF